MPSVRFYVRKNGQPGEGKIYAKFTRSRSERFHLDPETNILLKHWDKARQQAKPTCPDCISINLHLNNFRGKFMSLYRDQVQLGGKSFSEFKTLAQGNIITDEKKTLRSALTVFLSQYKQKKDEKTWKSYRALQHHLFGHEGTRPVTGYSQNIDFPGLDMNFYDGFLSFLRDKGQIDSTVYKTISKLKTFLSWAMDRGYPVNPVYKKWEILSWINEPIPLTLSELRKLEEAPLFGGPAIGRDYFCVEARTGQRISDTKRFNPKMFDGHALTFYRKKGSSIKAKEVRIPNAGFCAPAFDILRPYDFKLPEAAEQTINEWIKEALELAGITRTVTYQYPKRGSTITETARICDIASTHMGRKTFITLALQFMPPKIVMELAGIDSYQTLKHYDGKSEDSIVEKHLEEMNMKLSAG